MLKKKIKKKYIIKMDDKTIVTVILVLAAAHVLVSLLMFIACLSSKDKAMKKCSGMWLLSLSVCVAILVLAIMEHNRQD